jgi:prophage regulatory protein
MNQLFLKRKEVEKLIGFSYFTIYKLEREGTFPKRKQMSERRVGWLYSEVMEWVTSRSNSVSHA